LDDRDRIVGSLSDSEHEGQRIGEPYTPPSRPSAGAKSDRLPVSIGDGESVSDALDRYYTESEREARFRSRANAAIKQVKTEIARRNKLIERLNSDLAAHGDAERWKRYGDLLLANIATAERNGNLVRVTDYFDPAAPTIE